MASTMIVIEAVMRSAFSARNHQRTHSVPEDATEHTTEQDGRGWRTIKTHVDSGPTHTASTWLGTTGRRAEILASADRHIRHEHDPGVPIEQWPQAAEDWLDFLLRYDRHDHYEAFLLVKHEMRFTNAMVALARDVADDRVAARIDVFE